MRTKKWGVERHGQIYGHAQGWQLQFWIIWSEESHDVGIWEAREVSVTEAELLEREGRKYTTLKTHSFSSCQCTSISPGDRQHRPSLGCPIAHKSLERTDLPAATARQEPVPKASVLAVGSAQTWECQNCRSHCPLTPDAVAFWFATISSASNRSCKTARMLWGSRRR